MPSGFNQMNIGNSWARWLCLWARQLCLRAVNGLDIGNGPLGTMVTPSGFKGMNIGNGPSSNDGYALGRLMEWTSQLTIAKI